MQACMELTIYHNPRCSKSRKTLQLINGAGIQPTVVLYLKQTLAPPDILDFAHKLGMPVRALLREGEADFKSAQHP